MSDQLNTITDSGFLSAPTSRGSPEFIQRSWPPAYLPSSRCSAIWTGINNLRLPESASLTVHLLGKRFTNKGLSPIPRPGQTSDFMSSEADRDPNPRGSRA